jgi:hypothetical protein
MQRQAEEQPACGCGASGCASGKIKPGGYAQRVLCLPMFEEQGTELSCHLSCLLARISGERPRSAEASLKHYQKLLHFSVKLAQVDLLALIHPRPLVSKSKILPSMLMFWKNIARA